MKLEQPACINMQAVTGRGLFLLCALDQPSDFGDLMAIRKVLGTASVEEGAGWTALCLDPAFPSCCGICHHHLAFNYCPVPWLNIKPHLIASCLLIGLTGHHPNRFCCIETSFPKYFLIGSWCFVRRWDPLSDINRCFLPFVPRIGH